MSATPRNPADIRFLYFQGCPNAASTLENLQAAMKRLGLSPASLTTVDVEPDAHDTPFFGSPSITVDGVDLYTGTRPSSAEFSCRIFDFDGEKTGALPEHFIHDRLATMLSEP